MELKEYQAEALETFEEWLAALERERLKIASDEIQAIAAAHRKAGLEIPADLLNYPKNAWESRKDLPKYIDRTDGAERPIPHICFKVPTGGGKTLMAAAALERLNRRNGLTLWIVPSRAIYDQTKKALWDRGHPYRQMLERASGGRVKMMEKDDSLSALDVENYLCVMLLMYPAANRKKSRDFLKMFRDSGRYPTFFPPSDDIEAHKTLLEDHPDLDCIEQLALEAFDQPPVKHSLYNVFKMLRPVIVLDEAHKAYAAKKMEANQEYAASISRLNPSLVIELSATPNASISNLLVDISGNRLKEEEMIKLPINVSSTQNVDWQYALTLAHERLEKLEGEARAFQQNGGEYIRPIAVVRAERTGADQRDGERVHAEDVREFLTLNLAVPEESVAVKSASVDELGKDDLLSEMSPVRWIITKSALMEGWDCPFAYVLAMLDNTQAQRAVTQLVGRVMRQPYARRTGVDPLDQCYVVCWNSDVGQAVQQVKNGLEAEGLTGLGDSVLGGLEEERRVTVRRKREFREKNIFLPLTLHKDGGDWIELDYQRHILPEIKWKKISPPPIQLHLRHDRNVERAAVSVGEGGTTVHYRSSQTIEVDKSFHASWYARRLSDLIPNPWQAARIVEETRSQLNREGVDDKEIYDNRSTVADQLRRHVERESEEMAEKAFLAKLKEGNVQFSLEVGTPYKLAQEFEIRTSEDAGLLPGGDGMQLRMNLFEPIYVEHFDSGLERKFAQYLDGQRALKWWHRVAARQRGDYYLRGWKRNRIWPDFIAMAGDEDGTPRLLIFETKGKHIEEHFQREDTDYKKKVMEVLQEAFNCGTMKVRDNLTQETGKEYFAQGTFQIIFNEKDFGGAFAQSSERKAI